MVVTTTENDIKERLSIAYVTAVAARAGCQLSEVRVDRNRIDGTISPISGARVKIDVQLKATSVGILDQNDVVFDLDIATYDALRSTLVQSAQLLVVLILPDDPTDWLVVDEETLALKKCAYWRNLYGEPAASNNTTIRVRLPRSQILGPNELLDLIVKADARACRGQTGI
jgi:hypothetical protein